MGPSAIELTQSDTGPGKSSPIARKTSPRHHPNTTSANLLDIAGRMENTGPLANRSAHSAKQETPGALQKVVEWLKGIMKAEETPVAEMTSPSSCSTSSESGAKTVNRDRRTSQQDSATIDDALRAERETASELRKEIRDIRATFSNVQREIYRLGNMNNALSEHIDKLKSEITALELDNEELRVENEQHCKYQREIVTKHNNATVQCAKLQDQLNRALQGTQELRERETKLRDIILSQAETQKVTDSELVQDFLRIRQGLQKISRNKSVCLDVNPDLTNNASLLPWIPYFYGSASGWSQLSKADRGLRIRAAMYWILHTNILDTSYFGMGQQETHIETGLKVFEAYCREKQVPRNMVESWVNATIDCIEASKAESVTAAHAARAILMLLAPLQLQGEDGAAEAKDKLYESICEVCDTTLKLRVRMRKSKEGYGCMWFPENVTSALSSNSDYADEVAVEGGGRGEEASDQILYTVFGCLGKQREGMPTQVLEKAQVVMKRRVE